jgi:hypothetical protein
MYKNLKKYLAAYIIGLISMGVTSGNAVAGGLVEIDIDFANDFDNPLDIDNPYWPLLPGNTFVSRQYSCRN